MKIYVISLERAAERRVFMKKQLDKFGFNYEIVDAVDFQKLSEAELDTLTDKSAVAKNPFLTKGAQACALSHVKVCRKIVADNEPIALILEDDAIIDEKLAGILARIEQKIGNEEVVSLSYYHRYERNTYLSSHHRIPLGDGNELDYPVSLHHTGSTMAYVLKQGVAARLAEAMMPISVVADWWGFYFDRGAFSSFRCVYPYQLMPELFTSTLDYTSGQTLKTRLAQWIRKRRLPVLYPLLVKKDKLLLRSKYHISVVDKLPFHENPDHISYTNPYYARS